MDNKLRIAGSLFGLAAVLIGAFGAHGLEKLVKPSSLAIFETGVKYQMYHALLLLLIPVFALSEKLKKTLCILLIIGIILFSFSIYGLATNDLSNFNFKKIALLTPLGGTLLIIAWTLLFIQFIRKKC